MSDFEGMGFQLPPEAIAHLRPADCVVWHRNWPALELFVSCATQWRLLPMGGLQGLDYAAVRAVMQMCAVQDQRAMFDDIRLLERGALCALQKRSLEDALDG